MDRKPHQTSSSKNDLPRYLHRNLFRYVHFENESGTSRPTSNQNSRLACPQLKLRFCHPLLQAQAFLVTRCRSAVHPSDGQIGVYAPKESLTGLKANANQQACFYRHQVEHGSEASRRSRDRQLPRTLIRPQDR